MPKENGVWWWYRFGVGGIGWGRHSKGPNIRRKVAGRQGKVGRRVCEQSKSAHEPTERKEPMRVAAYHTTHNLSLSTSSNQCSAAHNVPVL